MDGQGRLIGLDGSFEVLRPAALDAVVIGGAEIVLGCGPVLRQGLAGVDGQGRLEGLDGGFEVLRPAALDAVRIGGAEIMFWVMAQSRGKASRVRTVRAASKDLIAASRFSARLPWMRFR